MARTAKAPAKLPQISDAEWEVMKVLWDRTQASAQDVIDALATQKTWSPQTVKTLLKRLTEKGALAYESEGRRFIYRPAVSREAAEPFFETLLASGVKAAK